MNVGMILKEAGYCTGIADINDTISVIYEPTVNSMVVKYFWVKKYDHLPVTAIVQTSDIVAIWKI